MGNNQCSCDNADRNMQAEENEKVGMKGLRGAKLKANPPKEEELDHQDNFISLQNSAVIERKQPNDPNFTETSVKAQPNLRELPPIENTRVLDVLNNYTTNPEIGLFIENKNYPESVFKISDDAYYQGEVIHGKREGPARQLWEDGTYFEGEFRDDQATGIGRLIHQNGDCYEGYFENSKANGKGKFLRYAGGSYEGDFLDDIAHGNGELILPNDSVYKGQFVDGRMTGYGELKMSNEDRYVGNFLNNQFQGTGKKKIKLINFFNRNLHLVRWKEIRG